jgi:coenzyme PQQ precursor peptide PqqA
MPCLRGGSVLMPPCSPALSKNQFGTILKNLNTETADLMVISESLMKWEALMLWSKPKLVEICVGLEINAYYPAEL